MKIDVRGLKKIKSDDKSTTFKTAKGHHFIVAHKAVAPHLRKQMDAIPHYDAGGEIENNEPWYKRAYNAVDSALTLPDEREKLNRDTAAAALEKEADKGDRMPYSGPSTAPAEEPAEAPEAQQDRPNGFTRQVPLVNDRDMAAMGSIKDQEGPVSGDDSTSPERAPGSASDAEPPQQEEPPTSAIQDVGGQQAAAQDLQAGKKYQKGFQDYYKENAQELGHEDAAWQHDLQNGHISRETYHDLFAKRDTLGKISMLFGLALGGLGSADTKMPNAYLAAMDKQIQGDYEAQTTSKGNAQNYLKIHQQQALNDAQIARERAGVHLTDAQAAAEKANADITGQTAFLMKKNRAALHHLRQQVENTPPGSPQRAAAEKMLYLTGQAIDAKNMDLADVAASKGALVKAMGDGGGSAGNEQNFQNNQRFAIGSGDPSLQKIAEFNQQAHIPGVGQASGPVPQGKKDELEAMNVLDYKAKDLLNYARQNKGSIDPNVWKVGRQKAEELTNYYNSSIKGGVLTEGRLKWLDSQIGKNPTSVFQNILGNNAGINEILQSNSQRKNIMLKGLGAEPPKNDNSPAAGPGEGTTQKSKSGKPMIFKNGKWHYQ